MGSNAKNPKARVAGSSRSVRATQCHLPKIGAAHPPPDSQKILRITSSALASPIQV